MAIVSSCALLWHPPSKVSYFAIDEEMNLPIGLKAQLPSGFALAYWARSGGRGKTKNQSQLFLRFSSFFPPCCKAGQGYTTGYDPFEVE